MKVNKIFTLLLALCMTVSTVFAANTFKADARTKRIPAGTIFKIQFMQPINSFIACEGDSFVATLLNEQSSGSNVILPAGTIVRGSVSKVNTAKRFSRGGKLFLDFDHVVTPNGRQIPLDLAIKQFANVDYDGGIYYSKGYGEAVKKNYQKGIDITKNATEYGLSAGESAPGIQYVTTPICAIGGAIGGAGYFIGDSVIDMFRKGDDIYINKGDILEVELVNPIDIPVY